MYFHHLRAQRSWHRPRPHAPKPATHSPTYVQGFKGSGRIRKCGLRMSCALTSCVWHAFVHPWWPESRLFDKNSCPKQEASILTPGDKSFLDIPLWLKLNISIYLKNLYVPKKLPKPKLQIKIIATIFYKKRKGNISKSRPTILTCKLQVSDLFHFLYHSRLDVRPQWREGTSSWPLLTSTWKRIWVN